MALLLCCVSRKYEPWVLNCFIAAVWPLNWFPSNSSGLTFGLAVDRIFFGFMLTFTWGLKCLWGDMCDVQRDPCTYSNRAWNTLRHFRSKALELQHLQVQSKEVKQKKTKHEWGLHISVHWTLAWERRILMPLRFFVLFFSNPALGPV